MTKAELFETALAAYGSFGRRWTPASLDSTESLAQVEALYSMINKILDGASRAYRTPDGKEPQLHFDFMHWNTFQAIAFPYGGHYFAGMALGMLQELGLAVESLIKGQPVLQLLNDGGSSADDVAAHNLISEIATLFVTFHEVGHHFLGHCDSNNARLEYQKIPRTPALTSQAAELMADRTAVGALTHHLLSTPAGAVVSKRFGSESHLPCMQALILAFGVFYMKAPSSVPKAIVDRSHPPNIIRLECSVNALRQFCEELNGPTISDKTVDTCIQMLRDEFDTDARWESDIRFVRSEDGSRYRAGLDAETRAQFEDRSKHWVPWKYESAN